MAFKQIDQIQVGSNIPGTVFGGYIYDFSCSLGSSESSTEISISVVSEDGNYTVIEPSFLDPYGSLNATDGVPVAILSEPSPIIFPSMYLTSYSIEESVGQRLLSLTLQDRSMILDKVQVALLNRDAKISLDARGEVPDTILLNGMPIELTKRPNEVVRWQFLPKRKQSVDLPVRCQPCDPFEEPSPDPFIETKDYYADQGWLFKIDPRRGGMIILGKEEFTSSPCNLPDVSYNFKELIDILHLIGIFGPRLSPIEAIGETNFCGITDRGNLQLRKNYVGSLREVLNNWARDFGYGMIWDPINDRVQGIDLTTQVIPETMRQLKNLIRGLPGESRFVAPVTMVGTYSPFPTNPKLGILPTSVRSAIESVSESNSLDGTYIQDHNSTFIKPGRVVDNKKVRYYKRNFRNVKISEVVPCSKFGDRNEEELLVSSALAKFNEDARTLFNWKIMRKCMEAELKKGGTGAGKIEPLGLTVYRVLEGKEKVDFMNIAYSNLVKQSDITQKFGKDCKVYLATYNEDLESEWLDWERKIADFVGKYYVIDKEREDQFLCLPPTVSDKDANHLYEYKFTMTTTPSTTEYSKKNKHDLPFEDILKHPEGANIKLTSKLTTDLEAGKLLMFSRNTAWGIKKEEMDDLFLNAKDESILSQYVPAAEKMEGISLTYFESLVCNGPASLSPLCKTLKNQILKKKVEPVMIFAPDFDQVPFTFQVSKLTDHLNKNESEPEDTKDKQKECGLICDLDVMEELCEKRCPNQETRQQPEKHGLIDRQAQGFTIMVNDPPRKDAIVGDYEGNPSKGGVSFKEVVFPSESEYEGYLTFDTQFRRAMEGVSKIYGDVSNAGETLAYQINKVDITGDLDDLEEPGVGKNFLIVPKTHEEIKAGVKIDENGVLTAIVDDPIKESKLLTARAYHNKISMGNKSNVLPIQTLEISLAGLDFAALGGFMNPIFGWQSVSITVDEGGTKCSLSWGTKPRELPEQDVLLGKISSRLRMNTYGRTY